MSSTYRSEFDIKVHIANFDDDADAQWCKVITASVKDKFTSATLGSATAYYVNTTKLIDPIGDDYEEIRAICPTTRDLVDLHCWPSPRQCEDQDDDPEDSSGLVIHELEIKQPFRRQGLGRKLVQAIINKVHQIARSYYAADLVKHGLSSAYGYTGLEVIVSTGSTDPSLAGYNRRVAMCNAQGVDPTEEVYAEPGSRLYITRKFWRSMGAEPMGFFTHLLRLQAKVEDEVDGEAENEEYDDLLQVKGVKRKREENAPGPSRYKRPATELINRSICVEMRDHNDGKEFTWCEIINAEINVPATASYHGVHKIASARAFLVHHYIMLQAGCDFSDMSKLSQEAGELYKSDLFADDGMYEPFVLFDTVRVANEHRRQGIGRDIVQAVLKKARDSVGDDFDVIAVPGFSDLEVSAELARHGRSSINGGEIQRQIDASKAFWKAVGAKKFGRTQFYFGRVNEQGEVAPESEW